MSERGELIRPDRVHWEHNDFRRMFPRGITPSDFDGWIGFTDLAGRAGGPLIILELKRYWSNGTNGQNEAFGQLRRHLQHGDWWIRMEHDATDEHVWPSNVQRWGAYKCGCADASPALSGKGIDSLIAWISRLDPFGQNPPTLLFNNGAAS